MSNIIRFTTMAISFPRLTWTILRARVQSTRTRMEILFQVSDCIQEVEA